MDSDGARPILTRLEQRVLGSLLEKERTVPASYPMTLNGVRTACNQTSGRDPIMAVVEADVAQALADLKARGLVRMVHASQGARVTKHRQVLDERLELDGGELAVLTLLLLRGPQTPGELRSRSERLHGFGHLSAVQAALTRLSERGEALVRELDRRPGQKEQRWVHLLGHVDAASDQVVAADESSSDAAAVAARDSSVTEEVLAAGPLARDASVVTAYDEVASDYADRLVEELDAKPFDRWLLERLADLAAGGPVADAGCGPGHVSFHLAAAGAEVTGFDLSPAMVDEARRRFGEIPFAVADLTALPSPSAAATQVEAVASARAEGGPEHGWNPPGGSPRSDGHVEVGWSAIAAWYSLVHLAGSELRPALGLLAGALAPGGWLALAVHVGPEVRRIQDWLGHQVDLTFALHDPAQVLDAVTTAGLVDVEWYRRGPYVGAEVETERLYVLARRPI